LISRGISLVALICITLQSVAGTANVADLSDLALSEITAAAASRRPSPEIEPIPPQLPEYVDRSCPEWDTDWIGVVYLSGCGGFWLAWYGDLPIGRVGAQDRGGVAELMSMFVVKDYRRRGVGTRLVNA